MTSPHGDPQKAVIWGVTTFHSETGTEGGYWAVQGGRGIDVDRFGEAGNWSYNGLLAPKSGDHLTIYDPESVRLPENADEVRPGPQWEGTVRWEGEIRLRTYPPFTEAALGFWIHHDQEGVPREEWARLFFTEHPCKLVTSRTPWEVGRYRLQPDRYQGIFEGPEMLHFFSDGTVRWAWGVPSEDRDLPPERLQRYLARMRADPQAES